MDQSERVLLVGIKLLLESDFKEFVKYFFRLAKGSEFVFSDHHDILCDALMDVYYGRTRDLLINMPPRYSKTELVVIMFSAWCFVRNPRCEFIHLSYADPLVLDNSQRIKDILNSVQFQSLWPHIRIKTNKDSKKAWDTLQGGSFYATAAGGAVTGFGAGRHDEWDGENFVFSGCIIIDDPLKPDDARSDTMREAVNNRWDEVIKNRRNNPNSTPTITIMQRIHLKDFSNMLKNDTEFNFKVISLEALIDEGKPTERALWPEKHNVEQLKAMKKKNSYVFTTQYQQNPVALGGNVIKSADFRFYKVAPNFEYRKMFIDSAMKEGTANDYSVLQVWGYHNNNIYLVDQLRGKWDAPTLKKRTIEFWNKHNADRNGTLRKLCVEDKASGTGLIQDIKRNHGIPVEPIERKGLRIQRYTRVQDAVPYIESNHVYLPEDAPWISDFVSECEAFTLTDDHEHDDQIDPMCDSIYDMLSTQSIGMFDI